MKKPIKRNIYIFTSYIFAIYLQIHINEAFEVLISAKLGLTLPYNLGMDFPITQESYDFSLVFTSFDRKNDYETNGSSPMGSILVLG